jgi:xylulose-5-phosphate/fructose-6-phosphate phosphoketolase
MKAMPNPLSPEEIRRLDAHWRAANYLSVGQIYLYANPLLTEPLRIDHIKPRLLGHWGTTPGLNFIYTHANRLIQKYDLNMIYICGPGHGGPGMVANTWLEGSYTERYPNVTRDAEGMLRLFTQFSFPGGIPSHDAPETRAGNWGTRCCTPMERYSTIRICWRCALSATARPKPEPSPPVGTPINFWIRCAMAR